ncbi:thioredoxin-like protein [Trametes polyzona]|nr:thioredoxin-like protein [Trametes polyzona]
MAATEQLTFYTAKYSPFAQRVHITLEEAHAKYTIWEFDVRGSKPEWYWQQVNPLGKVPALAFGGPEVRPDQPSPESTKLVESMALLEFLADIYPEAHLLPTSPILRAKARAFTEIFRNHVYDEFRGAFFLGKPVEGVLQALEKLQAALPPAGGFAVGEWSIADAAVVPFITRLFLFVRAGMGSYSEENWQTLRDALASERFAPIARYVQDVHERPSFQKTWGDDNQQIELWKDHPGLRRRAASQAEQRA